jgi:membrane-associated phospholipid phosphatase
VHYFSDVVGGYAAGLLWLAACICGLEVARPGALPATRGE